MKSSFSDGYKYVADNISGALGKEMSDFWIGEINNQINTLGEKMTQKAQSGSLDISKMQGFIAEIWHSDTLNLNRVIRGKDPSAYAPDVNTYASPDIVANGGEASLKYYKNASASLSQQSKSHFQNYMELRSKAIREGKSYDDFETYLKKRGIPLEDGYKSLYSNQTKVIPSDQLDKAVELCQRRIAKAIATGDLEKAERLKEVLATLSDTVSDGEGNSSLQLTREQAQKLAMAARDGEIDKELLKECGIDLSELVKQQDIFREAMRAGVSAAAISLMISLAPIVVNGISKLVADGEISAEELKQNGIAALSATAKGFINGSVTAALVAAFRTEKFGLELLQFAESANGTSIIAAAVVLTVGTIESGIYFAAGKINKTEFATQVTQNIFTTVASVVGGIAFSAILPEGFAFSYMLGSFIGSVIGGFIYKGTEKLLLSYCVHSGFTFFGLVNQNYEIPEEILAESGIEIFEPTSFHSITLDIAEFQPNTFSPEYFSYEKIECRILRRGIISAYSIGYI
ncbi:MAG: hypothetical protein IJ168_02415 [Eubacterium sp.]|nr:hypothetical protein [Eubacterium sp.]